jgi:hypothetical protein
MTIDYQVIAFSIIVRLGTILANFRLTNFNCTISCFMNLEVLSQAPESPSIGEKKLSRNLDYSGRRITHLLLG